MKIGEVFRCVVQSIAESDYTNDYGTRYHNIVIANATGQTMTVRIGVKKDLEIGQSLELQITNASPGKPPMVRKHYDKPYQGQQGGSASAQGTNGKEDVDWDAIARGKVKCNLVSAAIESKQITITGETDIESWVDYIMDERKSGTQLSPTPTEDGDWDSYVADGAPAATEDDIPFK